MTIPVGLASLLLLARAAAAAEPTRTPTGALRVFEEMKGVIVEVSGRVKPWVVHIEAVQKRGDQKYKVQGSGLILTAGGQIVTNHHIVDEAKLVTVTLSDGAKLEATVVGSDRQTDLALIAIAPPAPLPEPTLGDSAGASVGEWILAVGNPYGFDRTVYFGIVSGKGRTLSSLNPSSDVDAGFDFTTDFIQTDASIDPGSSGGPLVNLACEVIGINSMGLGRGLSFTIPINTVKEVVAKLRSSGRLARGWIGLAVQPLTREMAAYFGASEGGGVLVSDVQEGSPARKGGFRQGDIITELGGQPVGARDEEELNRFSRVIWSSEVGRRLGARVRRAGQAVALDVTVGAQPNVVAREVETGWGFYVKEITQDLFRDYLLEDREGVLVSFVEAGTPAGEGKLREGDVIKAMEGRPVAGLADFESHYGRLKASARAVLLLVRRRKDFVFLLLETSKYQGAPPREGVKY